MSVVGGKMTEIHAGVEQLRAPLRLEKWVGAFAGFAQTIFVAVENFSSGVFPNSAGNFMKCKRSKNVIVIY